MEIFLHLFNLALLGGVRQYKKISDLYGGNWERAWIRASERDLKEAGIGAETIARIFKLRKEIVIIQEKKWLAENKIELVALNSKKYPGLLREIPDAPFLLYVEGAELQPVEQRIAIVGMRKCSEEGERLAHSLAASAVGTGLVVVSGLARGIDCQAHRGAISAGGKTIAVIATGHAELKRSGGANLAREILESGGTIISEYPLDFRPDKYHFLARNRIISGLCQGTLIVEAGVRSGALNTACTALKQNRHVWAVPGPINKIQCQGTNNLIKKGEAGLFSELSDWEEVYDLNFKIPIPNNKEVGSERDPGLLQDDNILKLIRDESLSIDQICQRSGLARELVILYLTNLEMAKLAFVSGENKWRALHAK